MSNRNDKLVLVCDKCHRAACWYGEFRCNDSVGAGLVTMTVGDLRKLALEHPEYWTAKKFAIIYGEPSPKFTEGRRTLQEVLALSQEPSP